MLAYPKQQFARPYPAGTMHGAIKGELSITKHFIPKLPIDGSESFANIGPNTRITLCTCPFAFDDAVVITHD